MTGAVCRPAPVVIARAVDTLRRGGLVAMPTETVYGLACDASNAKAVARLYQAKGRPSFNPLIAHATGRAMVEASVAIPVAHRDLFDRLASAFWPGPLTLVLPAAPKCQVCDLARAGLDTVAFRVPDHPVAHDLIRDYGRPLVAPSANPSGTLSPTRAEHVASGLGSRVDLIIDGGPCRAGLESTIIALLDGPPALLRPGAIAAADIENVIGMPLIRPEHDPSAPTAPGQTLRHYAPKARLRLNALSPNPGEAFLGFGYVQSTLNLSPSGDLTEAAANLFTMLRALDARHDRIAVAPIPETGLGEAINDRLTRAAKG